MPDYRERCLREKGDCCLICGFDGYVQVHHVDGDRSNNDLDNLIPVCPTCHGKIHGRVDGFEEWYSELPENGDGKEPYRKMDAAGRVTIPAHMRDKTDCRGYLINQDDDGTIQLTPARVTTA